MASGAAIGELTERRWILRFGASRPDQKDGVDLNCVAGLAFTKPEIMMIDEVLNQMWEQDAIPLCWKIEELGEPGGN